jgi:hypothetical protein
MLREADIVNGVAMTRAGRLRFDAAVKDVENDYTANGRKSLKDVEARIRLHLIPAFGGRRMRQEFPLPGRQLDHGQTGRGES